MATILISSNCSKRSNGNKHAITDTCTSLQLSQRIVSRKSQCVDVGNEEPRNNKPSITCATWSFHQSKIFLLPPRNMKSDFPRSHFLSRQRRNTRFFNLSFSIELFPNNHDDTSRIKVTTTYCCCCGNADTLVGRLQ